MPHPSTRRGTFSALAALALFLLAPDALAVGRAWGAKKVVVYDHTGAERRALVRQTVAAFNRILPPRTPRLKHRPQPGTTCRPHPEGITVCERDGGDGGPAWDGNTAVGVDRDGLMRSARVVVMTQDGDPKGTLCHEFMHAVFNAPDVGKDKRTTSCLGLGGLGQPGRWDHRFAKKVYRQHARR